jgi:hypothetical protein
VFIYFCIIGHGGHHGVVAAAEVKAAAPAGPKGNMISVGFDILRKEGPMFFYAGNTITPDTRLPLPLLVMSLSNCTCI